MSLIKRNDPESNSSLPKVKSLPVKLYVYSAGGCSPNGLHSVDLSITLHSPSDRPTSRAHRQCLLSCQLCMLNINVCVWILQNKLFFLGGGGSTKRDCTMMSMMGTC